MKKLLIITSIFFTIPSFASTLNIQALKACSQIENDLRRLMCYDNIIANQDVLSISSTKQNDKTVHSSKQNESKKDSFGFENSKKQEKKKLDEIRAEVVKLTQDLRGLKTITLSNNQVWKQKSSEYFNAKEGDSVIIIRGVFDSFRMKKANTNRSTQVKRLQ